MSPNFPEGRAARTAFRWLERITAGLLFVVVLALAWILVVAHAPDWLRLSDTGLEVMLILILLTAALVLVSVVALWDTRRPQNDDHSPSPTVDPESKGCRP